MQRNLILIVGIMCLALGLYLLTKPHNQILSDTPVTQTTSPARKVFSPTKTTPQGQMLGDATNGLYYANPNNSLQAGVAYKFQRGETVYIFDGQKMRGIATGDAYFNFYGCSKNMRIIDCAPVYLMPSTVTKDMLNGEVMK